MTVKAWLTVVLALLLALSGGGIADAASWTALVPSASNADQLVTPIDLGTNTAGGSVATTGAFAHLGVAIAPDARTAYVVSAASHKLIGVDMTTTPPTAGPSVELNGTAPGNRGPIYIAISPNGTRAYISDTAYAEVLPIDLTTNPVTPGAAIGVGSTPKGLAFAPSGDTVYVATTNGVVPITVATNAVQSTITGLGPNPYQIAITPDGGKAYVTDNSTSDVYPITLPAGTVGLPISVGGAGVIPLGIAITPDGTKAYTANFGAASGGNGTGSTVTPITVASNTAGSPITVGGGPWSVAVTPDSKTAYVGNSNDGTVTPIDVATGTAGTAIAGVHSPRSLAITPDQPPVAAFAVTSAAPGSDTSFDASASTVRFGTIKRYDWDFGDGATATTTVPTTTHAYALAGTFTASVTETSSGGTSTTGRVYTGQTASSVGGPSARAERSVVVAAGPQPAVKLSTTALSLGSVAVGAPAAAKTVTVTNIGTAPLAISAAAVGGPEAKDFKLSTDACGGKTVAAGATCAVAVTFTPSAGGLRTAALAFADNASGSPHTVALSGTGATEATISGTVRDDAAAALAGARVSVCTYSTRAVCKTTATDAAGAYAVTVPPDTYQVEVFSPRAGLSGGSAIVRAVTGPNPADFRLGTIAPLSGGLVVNGQSAGTPQTFWTNPTAVQVPVSLVSGGVAGTTATTTINFWDDPLGGSQSGFAHGSLTVLSRYDAGGTPRLVSVTARTPRDARAGTLGSWATSLTTALAAGADVSSLMVQGVLTPPAGGPYFHGAHSFLITYATTYAASARAATAPDPCASPDSFDGQYHLPGGLTFDPSSTTVHRPDGTEINVRDGRAYGPDGQQIPFGTTTSDDGSVVTPDPSINATIYPFGGPGGQEMVVDTTPGPSAGRYGFTVDGQMVDLNTGVVWGPDGKPQGRSNQGRPDNPCKPDPSKPLPPPPPAKPPAGSGSGSASGGGYIDPSGTVTSHGIPVAGARVVLLRSGNAGFGAVPNGSTVMSPGNRTNPDRTSQTGHFGWDVVPGRYRVTARHAGCGKPDRTRVLTIPPAVLNLRLKLACRHLRRARTRTRLTVKALPGKQLVLLARVRGRHHPVGLVRFVRKGKALGAVAADRRTGRAVLTVAGSRAGIGARYAGDGRTRPSRSR